MTADDSLRVYDHGQRFLLCDGCGAPVETSLGAGRAQCRHCGAPLEVRMRPEAAAEAPRARTEAERLAHLRSQDVRHLPPVELAPLFVGTGIAPAREGEALARWQQLRVALRSAAQHEPAEQLFFLTLGLAEGLASRGELLRQRALVESALEVLSLARHRQLLLGMLARSACRAGDLDAAEAWLASCDAHSDELHADTAFRFARAYLDTARRQPRRVVRVLGTGGLVPLSAAYDAECAVLCAAAWEQLGQPTVAVDLLQGVYHGLGPLARRRADRFIQAHASWSLCGHSAPEAARRAAALTPAPPQEAATAAKILLGLASYAAVWAAASIVALPVSVALGDGAGLAGLGLSLASALFLSLLFAPLAWLARRKVLARRRVLAHGAVHAATVLAASAQRNAMYAAEGVVDVLVDLLVMPDDAPAYRTRCTVLAMQQTAHLFGVGASVVLRVDPADPSVQLVDLP